MRSFSIILTGIVVLCCHTFSQTTSQSLDSPFSDYSELSYAGLQDMSPRFMIRGYCYAQSSIPDSQAIGGFGGSGNHPHRIPPQLHLRSDDYHLIALPDARVAFQQKYKGMRLLLVNPADSNVAFESQDSRLYILQEARDASGKWRHIEYLPSSWCGNSYHRTILPAGRYWSFTAPRYNGEFKTKLRFRLIEWRDRKEINRYSNEFEGSINPEQFSKLQGYNPGGLMDPYSSVLSGMVKFGFIDSSGRVAVPPTYNEVREMRDRRSAVNVNGKWGFIDNRFRRVIPLSYDDVHDFSEGRAAVNLGAGLDWHGNISGGKWGFIDTTGAIIAEPRYEKVRPFHQGLAIVYVDGKLGAINAAGDEVIAVEYDEIQPTSYQTAYVQQGELWGVMNRAGEWLLKPFASHLHYSHDGYVSFVARDRYGVIDSTGHIIVPAQFSQIGKFYEGVVAVSQGKKWGYVGEGGAFVIEPRFDHARHFSHGLAAVKIGRSYGYIDRQGTIVIEPQFDRAEAFTGKSAIVELNNRQFLIDRDGHAISPSFDRITFSDNGDGVLDIQRNYKHGYMTPDGLVIAEPKYDWVSSFDTTLSSVRRGGKYGYINRRGEEVIQLNFDDASRNTSFLSEGLIHVALDKKWGFIDTAGVIVIKPQFDEVLPFTGGRAPVREGDEWGVIDRDGKFVIEPQFKYVGPYKQGFALVGVVDP